MRVERARFVARQAVLGQEIVDPLQGAAARFDSQVNYAGAVEDLDLAQADFKRLYGL